MYIHTKTHTNNKTRFRFFFTVALTMGIYFILTFPMFLAFFTMDIDTGEYIGIAYPTWLCLLIGGVSGISGNVLCIYLIKKYKL